ncbi:MAG TPA: MoxR family ATPase [Pseudogracilibacillus sp.]|nr:MoxR family ATPase [Pseudogracilibacillus sp.]
MKNSKTEQVIDEIKKVIIGKDEVAEKVFLAILSGGHVLLEDIPGVGKTTLALAFSKVLGLDFNRIQFTPDVIASDIVGFTMYDKNKGEFIFKEGVVMCNLLLADEINRTTSRTQSALLEVMEEKNVTVDGQTYQVPEPFNVIATQNPIGSYGTQSLPQSQLDRFMIKVSIGYPDFDSQVELLRDRQIDHPLEHINPILTQKELVSMQKEVQEIHITDDILKYITSLTEATRDHSLIIQGVSPRGALALSRMAKAKAFLSGRDFVIPEDVIHVFIDTCQHRMIMDQKAQVSHKKAADVLTELLDKQKTPDIKHYV